MKKQLLFLLALLLGINYLSANPIDIEKAKAVGQKFACAKFNKELKNNDLKLVYTGSSNRGGICFYVFNAGTNGFVIVSADDRFRPIVGYSDEGLFETENMSPELAFYLDKIIEARTSRNVVLDARTADEWRSVMTSGKLLSRNGGRGVDFICTTKWNQDSPYNLYAPEATSGPGGRCYAGCVATAMSQVMKRWNYPIQGTGSHTYDAGGWWGPYYPGLHANFGETFYDWEHMPERLSGNSTQEEIEAVATLMYHCGVSVNMGFAPDGSGANSEDVPYAISNYFSYSTHAQLKYRFSYSLLQWQNMLKESFDLGWPVYYSGHSESAGHAFVCDGYDDDDLFHFNWGWGGSSDGWFIVDEIDYADWAAAIFNFVPTNVYDYMPMQPENLTVEPSGDFDYSATIQWTNPTQNIHFNNLTSIDQIVVTRDGQVIYTENNVTPGANMSFTDHYMPTTVKYGVYAIVNDAKGIVAEDNVLLGPTCNWTIEMTSSNNQGWLGGHLSFINSAGLEINKLSLESNSATQSITLPFGHIRILWESPSQEVVEQMGFIIKNAFGEDKVVFEGASSDLNHGLFFIANNNCDHNDANIAGPKNLTASISENQVVLSWEPLAIDNGVINYLIYRDNLLYDISIDNCYTFINDSDTFHSYYVAAFTDYGETAPSNVCNLQNELLCEAPSNLRFEMTTATKVKLFWDAPQAEGLTGYMLYRRPKGEDFKRIKLLTQTSYTDNLTSQPDNCYEYAVCAYYSSNDCTSGYAAAQEQPELNFVEINKTIIPLNLGFTIQEGKVVLQWQEASMAESYNVYRDGVKIGHNISGNEFVDNSVTMQQAYRYTVTGQNNYIESNPSNEVYIDLSNGATEIVHCHDIRIYPNPTMGKIHIQTQDLHRVSVFNMIGQEFMNVSSADNQSIIDLSALPQGTYFIKVVTETGSKTEKIIKI